MLLKLVGAKLFLSFLSHCQKVKSFEAEDKKHLTKSIVTDYKCDEL